MDIEAILKDSTCLDADLHRPLLRQIDHFAAIAGVHKSMVWTPLADLATDTEVDWVRSIPGMQANGPYGLAYVGDGFEPTIETRMMASAAACVRNFVDARVLSMHRLLEQLRNKRPDPTVLLVPNFQLAANGGGHLPDWLKGLLLDLLYDRLLHQQITVLAVQDRDRLSKEFGQAFEDLLATHYRFIDN